MWGIACSNNVWQKLLLVTLFATGQHPTQRSSVNSYNLVHLHFSSRVEESVIQVCPVDNAWQKLALVISSLCTLFALHRAATHSTIVLTWFLFISAPQERTGYFDIEDDRSSY